jgi:hypothetical protein
MKAYISIPASELDVGPKRYTAITNDAVKKLRINGINTVYWDRSTPYKYHPKWLSEADVVIFALPNNAFKTPIANIPFGCRRELKRAQLLGKKIYIVYQIASGDYHFYKAEIKHGWINGIGGTGNMIYWLQKEEDGEAKATSITPKEEVNKAVTIETLNKELDYIWLAL